MFLCRPFLHGVHPDHRVTYFDKYHGLPHDPRHIYESIPVAPFASRIRKIALYPVPVTEADFVRVMKSPWKFDDYSLKGWNSLVLEGKIPHSRMTQLVVFDGPYYTPELGPHRMVVTEEIIPGPARLGQRRKRAWNHILPNGVEVSYSISYGAAGVGVYKTTSIPRHRHPISVCLSSVCQVGIPVRISPLRWSNHASVEPELS